MSYRLGVDVGGTFTDLQLLDEDTGELTEAKVPTTRQNPAIGFGEGVRSLLEKRAVDPADVALVVHGTTVVTNALLEREFNPAGLIVTQGYRGLLEYARVHVSGPFGTWLFYEPPARIVALENVREVSERVDRRGDVLVPLADSDIEASADWFRAHDIRSVGVSLMWSFTNPDHEKRIREVFSSVYPECDVVLSNEVLPEIREFERAFTTSLNAALKPSVGAYLTDVETMLAEQGVRGKLLCMKSSGGVLGAEASRANPVVLAVSGPAAGVLGMAEVATSLGFDKAITVDMGGTSTDISFIEDGKPLLATEGVINEYPIQVPLIDIHTIGAGGGSIAWIAAGGRARVGPQSAGSEPGPAAYGRGGTAATLTDANVVLGRFPQELLGGRMALDGDRAAEAVRQFGEPLGLDTVEAALTIVELGINNMDLAIREVSTRKGRDPRDCVLIAFGGAGPAHAGRLAELLDIPTVLFPPDPGVGSTYGLLSTDVRVDLVRSVLAQLADPEIEATIAPVFAGLADEAWAALGRERVPEDLRVVSIAADFRYLREQYTVTVDIPRHDPAWHAPPTIAELDEALEEFHTVHKQLCGFDYRGVGRAGCELVNLRVAAIGRLARPKPRTIATGTRSPEDAAVGTRSVYFESEGGFVETPVYERSRLLCDNVITGPAVVDEFDSTSIVPPGCAAEVVSDGTIVMNINPGA